MSTRSGPLTPRRSLHDYSGEVRQLKKMLGIDKVARDKQKGEGSVSEYIENLRAQAKEFGIMRETQLDKGIELSQQLIALITLSDNCDEHEQRELHVTVPDVVDWIREVYIPEFQAVDEHFREHSQRTWIRAM